MNTIINPPELSPPIGFSHAISSTNATTVFLAGQVSADQGGKIIHVGDLVKQFDQTLRNLQVVMALAGGAMTDITKLTLFVRSKADYKNNLRAVGKIYQTYFGKYFPAMTLVEVSSLFEDDALIEIEGIATLS
ncbi:MAG: RidA family protein [bacterium]